MGKCKLWDYGFGLLSPKMMIGAIFCKTNIGRKDFFFFSIQVDQ
jgi:hypothetical protein